MEYGKAFTFAFDDEEWVMKIILGGVFALLSPVLVGIPFVLGYMLELIRNVAEGRERPLPAWDELGDKFVQGLVLFVILIIVGIPLYVFGCINWAFAALADSADVEVLNLLVVLVSVCLGLVSAVYSALALPAFTIRYAVTRDFGATLNIGKAWGVLKANFGHYILIIIVSCLAGLIAQAGVILCFIGVFLTWFWAFLVQGHLYGQYYRQFVAPPADVLATQQ